MDEDYFDKRRPICSPKNTIITTEVEVEAEPDSETEAETETYYEDQ